MKKKGRKKRADKGQKKMNEIKGKEEKRRQGTKENEIKGNEEKSRQGTKENERNKREGRKEETRDKIE